MTNEEKLEAIRDRLPKEMVDENFSPEFLSIMTIYNYLDRFHKEGLIISPSMVTPKGKIFASICEEFDWQPSNQIIAMFVNEQIDESEREAIADMLINFRDDREKFLKLVKKLRGDLEGED